jgi:hypothetical protein
MRVKPYKLLMFLILIASFSQAQTVSQMKHKVLLADEGNQKVHYVDMNDNSKTWSISIGSRDMQLIGDGKVLLHTGTDFQEYDLTTHLQVKKVTTAGTVQTVFRTNTSGNTYVGVDGAQLKIVDVSGNVKKTINISSITTSIRLIRPTLNNTFLVGGGGSTATNLCEFDSTGKKIWEVNVGGEPYQAVRLANGNTVVSNGYGAQIAIVNSKAEIIRKFPVDPKVASLSTYNPNFFAGLQVLKNGNIIVANWQGHGTGYGNSGAQLLEFDSTGVLVSYWKQTASLVSSLHGVIVMDDLDPSVMNSDINGVLGPVNTVNVLLKDIHSNRLTISKHNVTDSKEFNIAGRLFSNKTEIINTPHILINHANGKVSLSNICKN